MARAPSNYQLLFTYVAPYFAYVLALMLPMARTGAYLVAWGAAAAALAYGWRWLMPLRGPRSLAGSVLLGMAAGVLGTALWVVIKRPFYEAGGGDPWPLVDFALRLGASGSVVAVFEELLFRGLLLGAAVQWHRARRQGDPDPLGTALHRRSVGTLEPGAWTPFAVIFSSVAFASGHAPGEWPAAFAYGLLMALLWIVRGDLLTPVVAHGTTNITLALWVRHTGEWSLW